MNMELPKAALFDLELDRSSPFYLPPIGSGEEEEDFDEDKGDEEDDFDPVSDDDDEDDQDLEGWRHNIIRWSEG